MADTRYSPVTEWFDLLDECIALKHGIGAERLARFAAALGRRGPTDEAARRDVERWFASKLTVYEFIATLVAEEIANSKQGL